ncbi:Os05g0596850 [Oryza sativa Japonica Group]|uniref:Os05g0596850 protein n=1 Tax=Oryza sativa subsp. japonica TaxID=39947 RepID=A0A0P0WRA4_ORYSJ|nr:Os05g0596850 [Oryza sativa Japonica Group]
MASLVPVKVTPLDEVGGGEHGVPSRRAPLKSPRSTRSAHASGEGRRWRDHRGRAKGGLEGNGGGEVEEEDAAPTKLPSGAREERKTETATAGGKWGWRRRGGSWPADALSPPSLSFQPLLFREAVPNEPPLQSSSPVPAPWQATRSRRRGAPTADERQEAGGAAPPPKAADNDEAERRGVVGATAPHPQPRSPAAAAASASPPPRSPNSLAAVGLLPPVAVHSSTASPLLP